jgi:hypothetical protein
MSPASSKPVCPNCKGVIPSADINVATDVAYCRICNLSHKLSLLTVSNALAAVDLENPPAGAWLREDGLAAVVGATHRSAGSAIGFLLFGLFWNGIVSIFVLHAFASTLRNLGLPLPEWFPAIARAPGLDSVGETIFLWIFLTPFILIGLFFAAMVAASLGGHIEVRITPDRATIFHGIRRLGWKRRFDPVEIKDVRLEDQRWTDSDNGRHQRTNIVLETERGKEIKFGSMLTAERRKFVAAALQRILLNPRRVPLPHQI